MKIKNIHIFGGGTVAHISNHFAITAPAYGSTARKLQKLVMERFDSCNAYLELTEMAGGIFETNDDISNRIEELKKDMNTKIIFFNCALVDFVPIHLKASKELKENEESVLKPSLETSIFGKYETRLETKKSNILDIGFIPSSKIIPNIRKGRKDIFLVGFKTTCNASKQEMYLKGLELVKNGSCNLVLVNDTKTHWNQLVSPEESCLYETDNRNDILKELVDITWHRSHLTFTQSTVVDGKPIPWSSDLVPNSLRTVVNYAINKNAYKSFGESKNTVGHFGIKINDTEFLTSIRKSNFNDLDKIGLVKVKTDGPDTVIAYGAKPSVGGQSQRIVFNDHIGYDCVFHAHIPLRDNHKDNIPIVIQKYTECGSHQCGTATSNNLKQFNNLKAVMLDNHGPNIIFNKDINSQEVIDFIESNFDLSKKTGGYQI